MEGTGGEGRGDGREHRRSMDRERATQGVTTGPSCDMDEDVWNRVRRGSPWIGTLRYRRRFSLSQPVPIPEIRNIKKFNSDLIIMTFVQQQFIFARSELPDTCANHG